MAAARRAAAEATRLASGRSVWRGASSSGRDAGIARPSAALSVFFRSPAALGAGVGQRRAQSTLSSPVAPAGTQLGAYLQECGAVWGEAADPHPVEPSADGTSWSWKVELPPERLAALHRGEAVESAPFDFGPGGKARFQLYPRGDADCAAEGFCSLWLWTDSEGHGSVRLRARGAPERSGGASQFCRLEDVLRDNVLEVQLRVDSAEVQAARPVAVEQSLQLTGLQAAEWCLFQVPRLLERKELVSSPPFRFHHVLLGDMYLELLPQHPHSEHCTIFFRCRVPTMKLRVGVAVGSAFAKSFIASGKSTWQNDFKEGACLQVNVDAPGVLAADGSLTVHCTLEEVVQIPQLVQDMMPRLDERASWPTRL